MLNNLKARTVKLLRWSEQYTKTDMVYLFKGGGWLTAGNVVISGATFLLAIAFANLLPKETYGSYKFILSITSILAIPTLQGMNTAITRSVAKGDEKTVIPAIKTRMKWGLLSAVGSLGVAGYYFLNGDAELTLAFLIAAAFLPFMDSLTSFQSYLNGKERFDLSTTYSVISRIVPITLLVGAIYFSGSLFIILFTYFSSYTASRLFFFYYTLRKLPPNEKTDGGAISYGKHLSLMNVIGNVARHLDKILLFHFLGAAEVAIYTIAISPPEQLKGVLKNVSTLALPRFSERGIKSVKSKLLEKSLWMGLVIIIGTGTYILLAPYFFNIFFPEYTQSVFYSQLFSLSLITAVATLPTATLQAHERKRELYQLEIYQPTLEIILLVLLVPTYGLLGAIISKLSGKFLNMSLSYFLLYTKQIGNP